MNLRCLHEEGLEGLGFKVVTNIGANISKAIRNSSKPTLSQKLRNAIDQKADHARRAQKTPDSKSGKNAGIRLQTTSRMATASPAIGSPRKRKFFGINPPNVPY